MSGTTMILAAAAGATAVLTPAAMLLSRAYTRMRELRGSLAVACYDANHDGLTGLANRRAFYAGAAHAVASPGSTPRLLLLADMDDFKQVNDALGHGVGDLVLLAVAQRLREVCGPTALVARLGGDEFAALLPLLGDETPEQAGQTVRTLTGADRVDVDGAAVWVSLSVGVVLVDAPADLATVLGQADAAMFRAKDSGTGVAVFDPDRDDHTMPMPYVRPEVRVRDLSLAAASLVSTESPVRTVA